MLRGICIEGGIVRDTVSPYVSAGVEQAGVAAVQAQVPRVPRLAVAKMGD